MSKQYPEYHSEVELTPEQIRRAWTRIKPITTQVKADDYDFPDLAETSGGSKARDIIIRKIISRGLNAGPSKKELAGRQTGDDNASPFDQVKTVAEHAVTNGIEPDHWEIKVDKKQWQFSVPRDKETENEVTIVFDRKK